MFRVAQHDELDEGLFFSDFARRFRKRLYKFADKNSGILLK
jgi:hypothetical protein